MFSEFGSGVLNSYSEKKLLKFKVINNQIDNNETEKMHSKLEIIEVKCFPFTSNRNNIVHINKFDEETFCFFSLDGKIFRQLPYNIGGTKICL